MSSAGADIAVLAARSIQMMTDGTPDEFAAVIHPDAYNRESVVEPPACRGRGPTAFHATAQWLRGVFADLDWEIHDTVVDGDLAVVYATMRGRQVGTFVSYNAQGRPAQAFPATGKSCAVTQTHWCRVADGKLAEHWANRDDLGMSMQLGWNPPSPAYLIRMLMATSSARRKARG
jgi:predicted ester cyclase